MKNGNRVDMCTMTCDFELGPHILCFSMFKTIYSRNEFSVYFVIESSSHVSLKAGAAVFHKIVFSYYLQRNKTLRESYKSYTCTMSTNFLHPYFHH